jgi:starvation-inducible DNA-binding protein
MGKSRAFPTRIDLAPPVREAMVILQQLADTFDLRSQAKQAHWNVKGTDFYQLHELFDELAAHLDAFADLIAERATTLGGTAQGTVRMAAAGSRLPELPEVYDGPKLVAALADCFAALARSTRAAADAAAEKGDASTADLLTEVSRGVDKDLWFLEAHLQA